MKDITPTTLSYHDFILFGYWASQIFEILYFTRGALKGQYGSSSSTSIKFSHKKLIMKIHVCQ